MDSAQADMRSWLLSSAKILPKRVDKLLAVLDDEEVDTFDHLRVFAGKIGGACDKLLTETTVGMIRAALACDAGALQVPLSPVLRTPERRLPPMDTSVSIGAAETPGGEEIAPPPAPRKLDIQPRTSSSRRLLDPTTGVARDFAATRLQAATRRFLAIGATLRLQAHTLSHNDNDKTKINTPCAPPSDAADAAVESTDDSALPSDGGSRGAGLNDEVGPAESLQIQHGTAPEMPPEPPPAGAKSGSAPSSPASAAERPLVGNPASASSFPQQHDAWQRWKQEHARRPPWVTRYRRGRMPDASAATHWRWSERQWRALEWYDQWTRGQTIEACTTPEDYADLHPEDYEWYPTLDVYRSEFECNCVDGIADDSCCEACTINYILYHVFQISVQHSCRQSCWLDSCELDVDARCSIDNQRAGFAKHGFALPPTPYELLGLMGEAARASFAAQQATDGNKSVRYPMTAEEELLEHQKLSGPIETYDPVDTEPDTKDAHDAHIDDGANGDDDDECLDECSDVSDLDDTCGEGDA